ncbi:MAG: gliding motility-associated C-terminal domain-containing protein [Bacteroidales bacterium]|nr:gliding motility-associated C-terminal domain-containing protein [Bacteroidales bacterium]
MKRICIVLNLLLLAIISFGQNSIVGGTTFDQKEGYDEWGWDFSKVQQVGPAGNQMSSTIGYMKDATDFQSGKEAWVVVDNPFKLGTNKKDSTSLYPNINDAMYVASAFLLGSQKEFYNYTAKGLKPGTSYKVEVTYYVLHEPMVVDSIQHEGWVEVSYPGLKPWDALASLIFDVNGDSKNTDAYNPTNIGTPITYEYSGTLKATETSVSLTIKTGSNYAKECLIGISDIKIYGTVDPKVISGQGSEMCRGEQTLLTLDRDYGKDAKISWERSLNGSSGWTSVSSKPSLYDEITVNEVYYRASVNGSMTEPLKISTIMCCETEVDGKVVYSSRETIYYEDFGYFSDDHEYVASDGTKKITPSNYIMHRIDCPFSMPAGAGSFDPTGQINDGYYGVVVPTSMGYKTDYWATWMTGNGAITQDHSSMINGIENSACLFMNVAFEFRGNIFEHQISGLCTGKKLTFECYVGNMSDGTSPILSLYIKSKSGNILGKAEKVSPGKGAGWQRIVIDDLILTESDIIFEIFSDSDGSSGDSFWRNGCDLCIDDIKIMSCSSPALDLFSDVDNLERATKVCSDPFELGSKASALLSSFYGSSLQYLFQYSKTPDDESSWTQIGSPSKASTYTIQNPKESSIFAGLKNGESMYFRVIAATENTLKNTAVFSQTDYCKNYSISPSVEAIIDCPSCTEPKKVTITPSGKTALCPGEKVSFTVTEQADASTFSYTWYDEKGDIVAGPEKAATLPLKNVESAGTYKVLVIDPAYPTMTSCQTSATVEVTNLEYPTAKITGGGEYCDGGTIKDLSVEFTGVQPFIFTYSENGTESTSKKSTKTTAAITPTKVVGNGAASTEYVYAIASLSDANCTATAANYTGNTSVVIGAVPVAQITADPEDGVVCSPETVSLKGAADVTGASLAWGGAGTGTSDEITAKKTGEYTLAATNKVSATLTCKGSAVSQAVEIAEKPVITLEVDGSDAVCSGESIKLKATSTTSGGTFTWTGANGTGATATVTKTASWPDKENVVVTVNYESAAGCTAEPVSKTVTFNPVPGNPAESNKKSYCMNASASDVTLEAVDDAGCTLTWYEGSTKLAKAPSISIKSAKTYNYKVTQSYEGCESKATEIEVTVNAKLKPEILIAEDGLCADGKTEVTVADAAKYDVTWSESASDLFDNKNTKTPTFIAPSTVSAKKEYTVHVYVKNSECDGENEATITVYPTPTSVISPSSTTICDGESAEYTVKVSGDDGKGIGEWSANTTASGEKAVFVSSGATAKEKITYGYTSSHGCKAAVASADVTVNAIPEMPTTTAYSNCVGKPSVSLESNVIKKTGTLNWYGTNQTGGTASASAPSPSTATATSSPLMYYVSQTVNGCESDRASISVTVNDKLTPVVIYEENSGLNKDDGEICFGTEVGLSVSGNYENVSWSGDASTYMPLKSGKSVSFSGAPAGEYAVKVSVVDDNGCDGEGDGVVKVHEVPSAVLSSLVSKCESDDESQTITATLTPAGIKGEGTWTGDVVKNDEKTAEFVPKTAGKGTHEYTYKFRSEDGCDMKAAATGSVEVFANPVISITPSVTQICESGANSGVVTVKMSGTYNTTGGKTQVFNYESATLNDVDATSGSFTSVGQTAGEHVVSLSYSDANGCSGTAETKVTVNARPVSDITMNPSEICDYDNAVTLKAEVNGVLVSEGTFKGTGVSNGKFIPSTQIKGKNTVTFSYTDTKGCSAEDVSYDITVNHTDAPQTTPAAASNIDVTDQTKVPALTATGSQIKWYSSQDVTTPVVKEGSEYQETFKDADSDGKMDVGIYTAYATQTLNGCQSDPAEATLTITDCKAKTPSAITYHACVGQDDDLVLKAESNQDGAENFCWFTDRAKVVEATKTTYASLSDAQSVDGVVETGETFSVSKDYFSNDEVLTFYVSEYYATDQCFSAATPVNVQVHAAPVPVITVPEKICSTEDEITVSYAPATGGSITSELQGVGVEGNKWKVQYDDSKTGVTTTTLTLHTEEVWGTGDGSATCEADKSEDFSVTHVLSPKGTGIGTPKIWSASKLGEYLPKMEVTYANDLGATLSVRNESNVEIGTSSPVDMKSHITKEGVYKYTVTQTLNSCPASSVSEWDIVECPTPAPKPTSLSICAGQDELPEINANGAVDASYIWKADGVEISGETSMTLDLKNISGYVSEEDMSLTIYTFTVQQDGDDGAEGRCYGPEAKVTVTVNPLPKVVVDKLNDENILCYAGGSVMASAKADGNKASGGVWSMKDSEDNTVLGVNSDGVIDPTFNGQKDGDYTLSYTYTDGNGCISTGNLAIKVEYPEIPTTTKYIGMNQNPVAVEVEAGNIESGAAINWYRSANAKTVVAAVNPWTIDKNDVDPSKVGEYSYFVSQIVNGCTSERKEQEIEIVACPWTIKTVENVDVCAGTDEKSMSVSPQDGMDENDITGWRWSKESDFKEIISGATSKTYAQSEIDDAGITTYYVSYRAEDPYSSQECWSEAAVVTTTVHSKPVISFAKEEETVCFTDGLVKINVNVVPGNDGNGNSNGKGTFEWSTSNEKSGTIDSYESYAYFNTENSDITKTTSSYTITYKYIDNQNCENSETRSIDVVYLEAPVTTGYHGLSSWNHDVEVKAEKNGGDEIHWFAEEYSVDMKRGDSEIWKTQDKADRVVEKTYYARQFNKDAGCYSQAAPAVVKIERCPIPIVSITDQSACIYESVPTLTAETNGWDGRNESKSEYRYYASSETSDYVASSDGSYTPSGITEADTYSYYVTEYNSDPVEGLTYTNEGCESTKKRVSVIIIETQAPIVTPKSAAVCEGEENPEFTAVSANPDVLWYEAEPGEKGAPTIEEVGNELKFRPTAESSSQEAYGVWAVKYANGCYSARTKVEYTIKRIPLAPESERVEVCAGVDSELTADAEEGATVNWFADSKMSSYLAQGIKYAPKKTDVGEYSYYVAQRVDGCWGPTKKVVYEVKQIPLPPVVSNPGNLCEYDKAPTLETDELVYQNVRWYSSQNRSSESFISDENSYTLLDNEMTPGTKRFYVTQTKRECESDAKLVSFVVNQKPVSPSVVGASMCEGDTDIPTLSTNMNADSWYADEDAQTFLKKDYTYTPDASEIGNKDVIYYVVREIKGCYSDTIPDTLHVIAKPIFSIGNDTILCVYDSVLTIQAQNYVPSPTERSFIEWSVSNGTISNKYADNEEHNITPSNMITAAGDYTITASYSYRSDVATCKSDPIQMKYSVKERARTPLVFSTVICAGDDIDLLRSLGSPNTVWHSLDGTLPAEWHGQSYKFQPNQTLDTGKYRFEIYDLNVYQINPENEEELLGCESVRDTIELVVAPGANTKLFGRDSVCMGAVGESYYTQYESTSQYYWTVTGDNLNYSKDATSTSVRYIDWMAPGIDTIMVYEQTWAGCEGFDTLIVRVAPAPTAKFTWEMPGASNVIELVDSTIQDSLWTTDANGDPLALPVTYTMAWNYGHQGTPDSQIDTIVPYNQRNFPLQEGGYLYGFNCPILTVTNDFGCSDTYTECIFVNISSSLYVPNAFSPTNPAHSVRSFQPKGFNLSTCEVSVYDKWGNLLWYSDEVEDGMFKGSWDGRYDGKMMKSDVYVWKIEATFLDGQKWQGFDAGNGKKTKFGSVTLVR